MKKFKFLTLILILSLLTANNLTPKAFALSAPPTQSNKVVLIDLATGNTLFDKNGDQQAYPASITKIMTVLLAVEAIEAGKAALTDSVTASGDIAADLSEDGSTSGIVSGETMTLEDLLYCTMLSSANEACNIIAEHISGTKSAFVDLMNARAAELGCTGTHFANTHGLPNYNHYTTADDMGKIAAEAYSHPLFMEICNTVTRTVSATNVSPERVLSNTNGLINNDSELYPGYYYQYAKGMKTGHTNDAGYCLVSTATQNDINLLCVVMGGSAIKKVDATEYTNFTDSIATYKWAFENYSYRDVLETTDLVKDIPVKMGREADYVTVHPQNAVKALMPNDEDNSSFEQNVTIYNEQSGEELVAPIEAGQVLGEISILRDGVIYGTSKLIACTTVEMSYSQYIKSRVAATLKKPLVIIFILLVLGLFGAYVYLVLRYKAEKRRHKKQAALRRRVRQSELEEKPEQKEKLLPRTKAVSPGYFTEEEPERKQSGAQKSTVDRPQETEAERDYFDEFFGRNKPPK